jgi:hypothetical protein
MHPQPAALAIDYEHVCLSTDEPEEGVPSMAGAEIVAQLAQRDGTCEQRLAILDNAYLNVLATRGACPARRYFLRLAFLDPKPSRPANRMAWHLTTVLAAASLALGLQAWSAGELIATGWTLAVCAALAATMAALSVAVRRSTGTLVFHTRHGRVPVLKLMRNFPDRRRAQAFAAALVQAIGRAGEAQPAARTHLLRDEMREHRRLLEAGIVTPTDFEAAKARILRAHG